MATHNKIIANLEALQVKVEGDDGITEAEENYCRNLRQATRGKVTKAAGYVRAGTYVRLPNITLAFCDEASDILVNLDLVLGDDQKSNNYLSDIDFIRARLKSDAQEQARIAQQQAHEKALRDAQLALEQRKLENEQQLLLDEQAKRDELHQAKLAAARQAPVEVAPAAATTVTVQQQSTKAELMPFDGSPCTYRQWERLFEASVEAKSCYGPEEKFMIFKRLIGDKGAPLIANLEPDQNGLATAKQRAREYFDDPTRVREAVLKRIQKLPAVTTETPNTTLREIIIAFESGLKSLTDARSGDTYINETFYRQVFSKLPDRITSAYLRANPNETAEGLIKHARSEMEIIIKGNERRGTTSSAKVKVNAMTPVSQPSRAQSDSASSLPRKCAICDGNHRTISCQHGTPQIRKSIVLDKRLCFRCLRSGHRAGSSECSSNYKCRQCGRPHSLVICDGSNSRPSPQASRPSAPPMPPIAPTVTPNNAAAQATPSAQTIPMQVASTSTQVHANYPTVEIASLRTNCQYSDPTQLTSFYQTVMVNINNQRVRVLLDGGAGRSLILEELANKLRLPDVATQVLNIGGVVPGTCVSKRLVSARLNSIQGDYSLNTILSVVPSLGNLKPPAVPTHLKATLREQGVETADTDDQQRPIQIILGLEYVGEIFYGKKLTNEFWGHPTTFGWVVYGVRPHDNANTHVNVFTVTSHEPESTEQPEIKPALTKLEKDFLQNYMNNKIRLENGRYVAQLPWIHPVVMGDNQQIALCRLRQLIRSLQKRNLTEPYREALEQMISEFAEPAPPKPSGHTYYLPHHPVVRLDKTTSRVRPVFDGSAHEKNTVSLNECLYKGLNTWDSLSLLLQFRLGSTAVVADIKQAFLQIEMDKSDRDALRFYWTDVQGNTTAYRFTVVPFGLSSSPFVLYSVLQKHFQTYLDQFTDVVPVIQNKFYVDDLVLAFPSITTEALQQLQSRTCQLFELCGMSIRKWRTNALDLDRQWSPDAPDATKVLGYLWDVKADMISPAIDIDSHISRSTLTKQEFAAFAGSIYDPLGLVSPFTVGVRLLMRKLWQEKLEWTDAIPEEHLATARQLIHDAKYVNDAILHRNVMPDHHDAQLLIFCDASKVAVGVVAYCRSGGEASLLTSKVKLAREKTIPELELDALVMAATLAQQLTTLYTFSQQVVICSDSLLNLQRLVKHPNTQKPSIALRVNQLKKAVKAHYRHVVSEDNIADLASRGCTMQALLANHRWWNGPCLPSASKFDSDIDEFSTFIAAIPVASKHECDCRLFPTYGMALNTFRKVSDFVIRATANLPNLRYSSLHADQLALQLMVKSAQRLHFPEEIQAIEQSKSIKADSVLRNYKCFVDDEGVLRLRTRLMSGGQLTQDQVCPILLPKECAISRLIVENAHDRTFHAGISRTTEFIRGRYYIIGMKSLVTNYVRRCVMCKRIRNCTTEHSHGSVPTFRYDEATPPFTNTGLDIFGPIKAQLTTPGKWYGLIFTCATTRAVHLELIEGMTAPTVFQAMRRFFARRGIPSLIYSDNGTQLIAIKKRLLQFFNQLKAANPNYEMRLKWLNLTASSPWRGGYYERLIRDVKKALTVLTYRKPIDAVELATMFTEIEGRMNSRPLCSYDGQVITPSHFFAGKPLDRLPPIGNDVARQVTRNDIFDDYIKSQRAVNSIWREWRAQYLLQLRQFHQNLNIPESDYYAVGDVVILKNNTPVDTWPLGRIESVHRSPDGTIRTVLVRTLDRRHVELKHRSVKTLIPLECATPQIPPTDTEPITA